MDSDICTQTGQKGIPTLKDENTNHRDGCECNNIRKKFVYSVDSYTMKQQPNSSMHARACKKSDSLNFTISSQAQYERQPEHMFVC